MDVESKSNELNQKTHWSQGEFDPFEKSFQEIFLVGPTILSELKKKVWFNISSIFRFHTQRQRLFVQQYFLQ